MASMLNAELMLESSEFFSALDDKLKAKFKARLHKRLIKKIGGEGAVASLADIAVTEDNVLQIQKHMNNILCFSWLGLVFGPLWAAYHRIPNAMVITAFLFIVAWPVLVVDYAAYLEWNRVLSNAGISVGVVFAMYGRAWRISHEVTRYLEIRFPAQPLKKLSAVSFLGTGVNAPWLRVLLLVVVTVLLTGIEAGLEIFIYG